MRDGCFFTVDVNIYFVITNGPFPRLEISGAYQVAGCTPLWIDASLDFVNADEFSVLTKVQHNRKMNLLLRSGMI